MGGNTYKLSLCLCCVYVLANGECCTDEHGSEDYPEPLSAIPADDTVTLGMLNEDHATYCLIHAHGGRDSKYVPADYECNCENLGFSWSPCDGCGSTLGGDRHAATGWVNDKVKV